MPTATLISVEEYRNTLWRPDCDYVDGHVVERNVGEQSHGRLLAKITNRMFGIEREHSCRVLTEVRLQVRPDRFRIPDLMLIPVEAAREEIVTTPPLLCIEILSRDDTIDQTRPRINDYLAMGVPVCWIVDPVTGRAVCATAGGWSEATDGILRAGEIAMPLVDVIGR